jgi:hypothetical protein
MEMKKLDRRWCWVLAVGALAVAGVPVQASAPRNAVQIENEKAGTMGWLLTKMKKGSKPPIYAPEDEPYDKGWRRRKEVEGYWG